jgi:hypothetical protein
VPFLRLTRDRRGIENTFLMHADRPGDRPRLLYWYRTAPGITLGRSPLDEDAIRAIEEQHPDIDFDWPAILALSEVMTPEDEAPAKPQPREQRRERRPKTRDDRQQPSRESRRDEVVDVAATVADAIDETPADVAAEPIVAPPRMESPRHSGLVDQLAGREIASRLRGRYAEITMRIRGEGDEARAALMKRAEALDPDRWDTPEAVLQGVSNADALFEQLRAALHSSRE